MNSFFDQPLVVLFGSNVLYPGLLKTGVNLLSRESNQPDPL